jgi:20S proteasome alpha/beta subunit
MLGQQPSLRLRQRDPRSQAHVRRQGLLLLAREFARIMAAVRVDPGIAGQTPPHQRLVDVRDAYLELRRCRADRNPAVHSTKHSVAQILRVALPRSPTHRRLLRDGIL